MHACIHTYVRTYMYTHTHTLSLSLSLSPLFCVQPASLLRRCAPLCTVCLSPLIFLSLRSGHHEAWCDDWGVRGLTPISLVEVYRRFRYTGCRRNTASTPNTSVHLYETTRRHIPEDIDLYSYRRRTWCCWTSLIFLGWCRVFWHPRRVRFLSPQVGRIVLW